MTVARPFVLLIKCSVIVPARALNSSFRILAWCWLYLFIYLTGSFRDICCVTWDEIIKLWWIVLRIPSENKCFYPIITLREKRCPCLVCLTHQENPQSCGLQQPRTNTGWENPRHILRFYPHTCTDQHDFFLPESDLTRFVSYVSEAE